MRNNTVRNNTVRNNDVGSAPRKAGARLSHPLNGPVLPAALFDVGPLVWAGLLLVIAEAFRRGQELSDDVAGLV